jgi:hypothetical protein
MYEVKITVATIRENYPDLTEKQAQYIILFHEASLIEGALQNIDGIVNDILGNESDSIGDDGYR